MLLLAPASRWTRRWVWEVVAAVAVDVSLMWQHPDFLETEVETWGCPLLSFFSRAYFLGFDAFFAVCLCFAVRRGLLVRFNRKTQTHRKKGIKPQKIPSVCFLWVQCSSVDDCRCLALRTAQRFEISRRSIVSKISEGAAHATALCTISHSGFLKQDPLGALAPRSCTEPLSQDLSAARVQDFRLRICLSGPGANTCISISVLQNPSKSQV